MLNVQIKRHTGKTIIFHKGELKKYLKVEINLTQIHSYLNFFISLVKTFVKTHLGIIHTCMECSLQNTCGSPFSFSTNTQLNM